MLSKCVPIIFLFQTIVFCQRDEDFLPKNVKPLRYTLTFELINSTHYRGSALIEIEALENTNNVTFHARELYINDSSAKVVDQGGNVRRRNCTINSDKEYYTINLEQELKKNEKYNISIDEFVSTTLKDKYGFYRAEYQDYNGGTKYLYLTEFSPTHARSAFPCFDETASKATFIINLIRSSEETTGSNMPLLKTIDLGYNRYQDVYQETPLISTYLVAFAICSYKYTANNGLIRIFAPEHFILGGTMDYTLNKSSQILNALEEYTGINYTLPKLDMVAVPIKYFVDGAMENWGFITYSGTYLHCPHNSTAYQFQLCLTFTAHEFSHQWFGNLATPKKWNYLWLSEGFGSYFQYHIADKVEPSWRLKEQFLVEVTHSAMRDDYFLEPIDFEFLMKDDFPNPQIYYQKASSIIRMVSHILTEDVFQKGLRIYLKNNQFKCTEPKDLYNGFHEALTSAGKQHLLGNLTIYEFMKTWTTNLGLPIITANRNYSTGAVTFTQKSPTEFDDVDYALWHIPLTYVFSDSNDFDFEKTTADLWMSKINATVSPGHAEGWYLVNKQAAGYYYVNYDETNWKRLTTFLKSKDFEKIPPLNRAQLINDAFYFASLEALDPEILFNLTTYLEQETDYIPVLCFIRNIREISETITKFDDKELFKAYLRKTLKASFFRLGVNNKETDTHVDRLHRVKIFPLLCANDDLCKDYGLTRLRQWMDTGVPLGTEVDTSLLCGALEIGTVKELEFILEQYFACASSECKKKYFTPLTCAKDPAAIRRYLEEIFNANNTLTPEDRSESITQLVVYSDTGKTIVLEYLLKIEDDTRYKDVFSSESKIYIEMSEVELKKFAPLLKQRIKTIPIGFLIGEDYNSDIAELFMNWWLKYSTDNEV